MVDRIPFAELHCHTNFSFLDGASAPDELVERAVALGLSRAGRHRPPGPLRRRPLRDGGRGGRHPSGHRRRGRARRSSGPGPGRPGRAGAPAGPSPGADRTAVFGALDGAPTDAADLPLEGRPARPRPTRTRLPGHRTTVKEDLRGVGAGVRGPHLVLLARDGTGYRSLCRLVSRANMAGTKAVPRFSQALLAEHAEGLVALSGCRDGEIARRLLAGDREGAAGGGGALRGAVRRPRRVVGESPRARSRRRASSSSSSTTSRGTTTGSSRRWRAWPRSWACRWS